MDILRKFAGRFPQQATQLKLLSNIVAYHTARLVTPDEKSWADYVGVSSSDPSPINDLPICFAARVILERKYKTLIEIGTYDGQRAVELKRLFPDIEVFGLDIQEHFKMPFERGGVTFRLFDLDFIRQPRERSAIFSAWVLGCMTPRQLDDFLHATKESGADIIFRESTPAFQHVGSLRRAGRTWYHDFDAVFATHGYTLMAPRHIGQVGQFDMNFFELGYFNVATLR